MKVNEKVLNYWAAEEVLKNGYKLKLKKSKSLKDRNVYSFKILFPDGDVYANFEIVEFFPEAELNETKNSYIIKEFSEYITEELEFTDSLNECLESCIYRFYTRY